MQLYLDESGDLGFKFRQGSSRYLVLALLLVDDPVPLHQAVHDVRMSLGLPEVHEFKFASASHEQRLAFFAAIRPHAFDAHCLEVNKYRLDASAAAKTMPLYAESVRLLLDNVPDAIHTASLVVDESFQGRSERARLATALRRDVRARLANEKWVFRVRYHQSHRDNLIQVADMVVGAVARQYERSDEQYRRHIRSKLHVLEFPPHSPLR